MIEDYKSLEIGEDEDTIVVVEPVEEPATIDIPEPERVPDLVPA